MSDGSTVSGRPKRKIKIKSDVPVKVPKKWETEEMKKLLACIMEYGHKDFDKLKECLPERTLDNIKSFMRTVYDTAGKQCKGHDTLDPWINLCMSKSLNETPWKDSVLIAQVMKYLSVDGLIENHPLPERCQGINFGEAYRLLYQALMGYPIQPVNEPTAMFIHQTLRELTNEAKAEVSAIKNVKSFFIEKQKDNSTQNKLKDIVEDLNTEKPLKVYQRKKPKTSTTNVPSLKIVIEPGEKENSSHTQDYVVTIEGNNTEATVTNVSVPVPKTQSKIDEEIEELQTSSSYNPFQLPSTWLQEPLYLNLNQKL